MNNDELVADSEDELAMPAPDVRNPDVSVRTNDTPGLETTVPKPRPKPRPRIKKTNLEDIPPPTAAEPYSSTYDSIYGGVASIADRAKTRTRNPAKPPTNYTSDIIELTDDDIDELASSQPSASRKKPKPKTKTRHTSPPPTDSIFGSQHSVATFPDAPLGPAFPIPSSSLPPSDFPMPSTPTTVDLPPIAILPQSRVRSLSPLFTPEKPRQKSNQPPQFFASSSSGSGPPADSGVDLKNTSSVEPPPKKPADRKRKKADQDEDDEDFDAEAPKKSRAKPKPKKVTQPRKPGKKAAVDPDTDGQPAPKGKKKAPKAAESFKSREFVGDDDDELNLTHKPKEVAPVVRPPDSGMSDLSSVPDSDAELELPNSKSTKRRSEEEQPQPSKKAKVTPARPVKKGKGKGRVVIDSDDSDGAFQEEPREAPKAAPVPKKTAKPRARNKKATPVVEDSPPAQIIKENVVPESQAQEEMTSSQGSSRAPPPNVQSTPTYKSTPARSSSIMSHSKDSPMSQLIRRVQSQPGSLFHTPSSGTAYSPYAKSSKRALSRMAPLHPNRQPMPPPKPYVPPKKTAKEQAAEDRWEEELQESVGIDEWVAMSKEERDDLRRTKKMSEMQSWED